MHAWFLLIFCVANINAQGWKTFGIGLSSRWLFLEEVIIRLIKVY
jgi:hypothetical protein